MDSDDAPVVPVDRLTRRDFCRLAGCVAALGFAGCTDEGRAVLVGSLGPDGAPGSDQGVDAAEGGGGSDAAPAEAQPDAGAVGGPLCSGGSPQDVGLPTAFAMGTATYFSSGRFFVVRDSGGVYALSSQCTHRSVKLNVVSGAFQCPRHGARFDLNGALLRGPASSPLRHYAVCMLSSGHVGVDTSRVIAASVRIDV